MHPDPSPTRGRAHVFATTTGAAIVTDRAHDQRSEKGEVGQYAAYAGPFHPAYSLAGPFHPAYSLAGPFHPAYSLARVLAISSK